MATVPLGARSEHRSHALCGRVCLQGFLYREFVQALGGDERDAQAHVGAWARELLDAWSVGEMADTVINDEPIRWWRARWKEHLAVPKPPAEAAAPAGSRWPDIFEHLVWILGRHAATQWFGPLTVASESDTALVLDAPETEQGWITRHYAGPLGEAAHAVKPGLRVEVRIKEST